MKRLFFAFAFAFEERPLTLFVYVMVFFRVLFRVRSW